MSDIGTKLLPPVNHGLSDLKGVLEGLRGVIPGANKSDSSVGTRALEGAGVGVLGGALIGALGGPVGALGGAVIGGVGGVAAGYMEQQAREAAEKLKNGERPYERPGDRYERRLERLFQNSNNKPVPPIHLNLNIDGRALAAAVSEQQTNASTFTTDTPASNGTSYWGQ
jgi:hypothetical protein